MFRQVMTDRHRVRLDGDVLHCAGVAAMAQMLAGLATGVTSPRLLSSVFLWDRHRVSFCFHHAHLVHASALSRTQFIDNKNAGTGERFKSMKRDKVCEKREHVKIL